MEFNEKLQALRKSKGITQEELAEELFVSRTAVSKWESGRGYPNIESLKEISRFFSVSIDNLLSADKVVLIAEKENKENIRRFCNLMAGITDLFSIALIVLPLYPYETEGFIYAVNLIRYTQISSWNLKVYWVLYIALLVLGIIKLILMKVKSEKPKEIVTGISVILNILMVIYLVLAGEVYAAVAVFLLLIAKAAILLKLMKSK